MYELHIIAYPDADGYDILATADTIEDLEGVHLPRYNNADIYLYQHGKGYLRSVQLCPAAKEYYNR